MQINISIVDLNRIVHSNNDFGFYHQQGEYHKNTSSEDNEFKDDHDVLWDELGEAIINKGCMKSLVDVLLQVVQTQQQLETVQNVAPRRLSWQCPKCTYMI